MDNIKIYLSSDLKLIRSELPPLIRYNEGVQQVVYSRALDLYGYGLTQEEAEESFYTNLAEFIMLHKNQGSLETEMKRLGWEVEQGMWKYMTNKRPK